ncbi:MAG: alpha-amylase family glycosyl hydrolase, partial [Dehalococcoidales bacterium]
MNKGSRLGATYLGNGRCQFIVWAPIIQKVEVHIVSPKELIVPLARGDQGYHQAIVEGVEPGCLYFYRLGSEKECPDPASRSQPGGVHGPSQVVDSYFPWEDQNWAGLPLEEYIVYELHVGAFTKEGTFDAIIPYLDELKDLGITAVELMPVAQFPGNRNWGYDGAYPFAVQDSYGGPEGLKRLVNACHQKRQAVVLDVVYNHLGPEGNYVADFGPYFTDRYKTLWGA